MCRPATSRTMLFSTFRSTLLLQDDQKEAKAELLELRNYDENASTPLEKPKRGMLSKERSQYFRFSREDSASVLVSDFESGINGSHGMIPNPVERWRKC